MFLLNPYILINYFFSRRIIGRASRKVSSVITSIVRNIANVKMSVLDQIYNRMNDDLEILSRIKEEKSEVQKFYEGKTLFITGVTGFMGKCLLEILLRKCSDLKHVYILLRPKKCKTIEERLTKYFQHEIFSGLRRINPKFEKKVTAVEGDLLFDNLGLSKEDADILKKEINIIFHNAANVKFNERVNNLLKVNVLGTKNILDLAEQCQNLKIFMYVSSAYSHCYRQVIEEQFYTSSENLSMIYDMIDADIKSENGLSENAVKMLIGNQFNVYTFTKAMSEELIKQRSKKVKFACGVYRPTMVISTAEEPLVGWIGNANGPVLAFITAGLGIVHTYINNRQPMDLVPCDFAINALLIVTWDLANKWTIEKEAEVYNYGSSVSNPVSLAELFDNAMTKASTKERSSKAIWISFIIPTTSLCLFTVMHILFHFMPACIADTVLLLSGNKPQALSAFWRTTKNIDKVTYFSNTHWKIHMPKTLNVIESLNSVDKELFKCDIRKLNWEDYTINLWRGLRRYILKESLNSNANEKRYILLWYANLAFVCTILFIIFYSVFRLF